VTGSLQADNAWSVAQGPVVITCSPAPQTLSRLDLRLGALRQAASLRLPTGENKAAELKLSAEDDEYRVGIVGKGIVPWGLRTNLCALGGHRRRLADSLYRC